MEAWSRHALWDEWLYPVSSGREEGVCWGGGGDILARAARDQYIIIAYDISTWIWATLPPYITWSKMLGVWDADDKQWTHPYPEMHIERSSSSAVVYNEWLVVVGGVTTREAVLSSVEVMNIESKQWYAGPQTCVPWYLMKTAIVGDES